MGLIGTLGALPTIYSETLILMSSRGRAAAIDFLDQFHHRLVSLFYRAWQKYHIAALWEQGREGAEDDRFTRQVFDLICLGLKPLRDRQAFPDGSLLFYAGLLAQQHRSAVGLEALLRDYFGHPATVVTFCGQWLRLAPDQRSRMGRGGAYNRLGLDTVAGHKAWDVQSHFRVRIGPLRLAEFVEFLPGDLPAPAFAEAARVDLVTRFYVRAELDFDVQPILRADEVPWCRASRGQGGSRLGRTSWLKCKEFARDAEDAVFRARAMRARPRLRPACRGGAGPRPSRRGRPEEVGSIHTRRRREAWPGRPPRHPSRFGGGTGGLPPSGPGTADAELGEVGRRPPRPAAVLGLEPGSGQRFPPRDAGRATGIRVTSTYRPGLSGPT